MFLSTKTEKKLTNSETYAKNIWPINNAHHARKAFACATMLIIFLGMLLQPMFTAFAQPAEDELIHTTDDGGIEPIEEAPQAQYQDQTYTLQPDGENIIGGFIIFDKSSNAVVYAQYSITKAVIPSQIDGVDVKAISSTAFFGCESLEILEIGTGVESIGESAFYGCTALTNVTLPSTLLSIERDAFSGCTSLTNLSIPPSVERIINNPFTYCDSLETITADSNPMFDVRDGALVETANNRLICYPPGKGEDEYTIPHSIETIASEAFVGNKHVKTIALSADVSGFEPGAVKDCEALSAYQTIDSMHYKAVDGVLYTYDGTALVAYPNSREGEQYTIAANVEKIYGYAFAYAYHLRELMVENPNIIYGENVFTGANISINGTSIDYDADGVLYVGSTLVEAGELFYLDTYTVKEGTTAINDSAFMNSHTLSTIILPDSVKSIGESAFENCDTLTSITMNGVETIGERAFAECNILEEIAIPKGVTALTAYIFSGCKAIESITIPQTVQSIQDYAFEGCESLTSVTIERGVAFIGEGAFYGCSSLNMITYGGTQAQWAEIEKQGNNDVLNAAQISYAVFSIEITSETAGVANGRELQLHADVFPQNPELADDVEWAIVENVSQVQCEIVDRDGIKYLCVESGATETETAITVRATIVGAGEGGSETYDEYSVDILPIPAEVAGDVSTDGTLDETDLEMMAMLIADALNDVLDIYQQANINAMANEGQATEPISLEALLKMCLLVKAQGNGG